MKKIFILALLCVSILSMHAQEHLKFMGVPIGLSTYSFKEQFSKAGFYPLKVQDEAEDAIIFHNSELNISFKVYYIKDLKITYMVEWPIVCDDFLDADFEYEHMNEVLKEKYGYENSVIYPFGIVYNLEEGTIRLTLLRKLNRVVITYTDKTSYEIYESLLETAPNNNTITEDEFWDLFGGKD